jgi:hypothetical protein
MTYTNNRLALLVESFKRLTKNNLLAETNLDQADIETALWTAPRVIVAHGTEPDPLFFYGNRKALEAFDMEWSDFVCLPSRYSAEPLAREARATLLARVHQYGFIDDYSGIRISAKGQRFYIKDAVVWNITDQHGTLYGQAATFEHWHPI